MPAPYAKYFGTSPVQKAHHYYYATNARFARMDAASQLALSRALVSVHEPHALLAERMVIPGSGGALPPLDTTAADQVRTATDRLRTFLLGSTEPDGDSGTPFYDAAAVDPDTTRAILEECLAKLPKAGAVAASSRSAERDPAAIIARLTAEEPGFAELSWHEKNRRVAVLLAGAPKTGSAGSIAPTLRLAAPAARTGEPAHLQAIRSYAGANDVERAINYLDAKEPGFKGRSWHEKNFLAGRYLETGTVGT